MITDPDVFYSCLHTESWSFTNLTKLLLKKIHIEALILTLSWELYTSNIVEKVFKPAYVFDIFVSKEPDLDVIY